MAKLSQVCADEEHGECLMVDCACICHGLSAYFNGHPRVSSDDPVNHPNHYTSYKGLEIIDLTEQMNFNRGNAVKYIARAGLKNPETEVQDLEKARWYIDREIQRVQSLTTS